MQLTAQEEYGLRCLLQVAKVDVAAEQESGEQRLLRIPEIAEAEGLSPEYTAKLMRLLRRGGLVESIRGAGGGYKLAQPAREVTLWEVMNVIGTPLFSEDFCETHPGQLQDCVHATDCSIRAMWRWMGEALRVGLQGLTLADLLRGEASMAAWLGSQQQPAQQPGSAAPAGLVQIGLPQAASTHSGR